MIKKIQTIRNNFTIIKKKKINKKQKEIIIGLLRKYWW